MPVDIVPSTKGLKKAKRWGKGECFLLSWDDHLPLYQDSRAPGSWGFRLRLGPTPWLHWFSGLWNWTGATLLGVLDLQIAGSKSWDMSASIMGEPIAHNNSLPIYLYLYLSSIIYHLSISLLWVLFLWKSLTQYFITIKTIKTTTTFESLNFNNNFYTHTHAFCEWFRANKRGYLLWVDAGQRREQGKS